ncbi:MAG: fibronectin type III domain-containing protein [Treponema sp.]|jgi:fibronectin type 3 domain-containing protein|nr:fibronectin type III domain-containing protein [Treponema sp.]
MANKKFLLGILVMALVFGMTVVGCDDDTDENITSIPAPTGLNAVSLSTSSIRLSWNYVSRADSYIVYRGNQIIKAGLQETNYIDTGLVLNTTYTYKVAGQKGNTVGTQSSPVSVKTGDGALKRGMTPQEMLECTSGSLGLTQGQWESLKNIANWVVEYSYSYGVTIKIWNLYAYPDYLELNYYDGGGRSSGKMTAYRYYR